MKYQSLLSLSLVSVLSLSSGSAQQDSGSTAATTEASDSSAGASTSTTVATSPNYVLSPNDLVDIRVFQEDDLRTTQRIPQDGTINYPLIGTIRIGGRSVSQATDMIRSALQRDYLVNPQVSLTITQYARRQFSIIGQVQKPGSYNIPDETQIDLLQAVAMAGGYTRIANPGDIAIKRTRAGQSTVLHLNGKRMAKDKNAKSFQVEPGDTISVPESIF